MYMYMDCELLGTDVVEAADGVLEAADGVAEYSIKLM